MLPKTWPSSKRGSCGPITSLMRFYLSWCLVDAFSFFISSSTKSPTFPFPFVVRSTVASCMTTATPSFVKSTSNSTAFAPFFLAFLKAPSVFSGASNEAPRWAIIRGEPARSWKILLLFGDPMGPKFKLNRQAMKARRPQTPSTMYQTTTTIDPRKIAMLLSADQSSNRSAPRHTAEICACSHLDFRSAVTARKDAISLQHPWMSYAHARRNQRLWHNPIFRRSWLIIWKASKTTGSRKSLGCVDTLRQWVPKWRTEDSKWTFVNVSLWFNRLSFARNGVFQGALFEDFESTVDARREA